MRILITGARAWTDRARLEATLDGLTRGASSVLLVSGACPTGADRMGEDWAAKRGHAIERHPADWNRHGKSAGYKRNAEMVTLGADVVAAFPAGEARGTRHTIRLARQAGLPLHVEEAP